MIVDQIQLANLTENNVVAPKTSDKQVKDLQKGIGSTAKKNLKRLERNDNLFNYRNNLKAKLAQLVRHKKIDKYVCESVPKCMLKFINERAEVCSYICSSCEGLFFKRSVHKITKRLMEKVKSNTLFATSVINYTSPNNANNYLCTTCYDYIRKGQKIPPLSTSHGLGFRDLPDYLSGLSPLEERLISPILPFQYIMPLMKSQVYGELGMRGSIVCVPNSLATTVDLLPRRFDDTCVVQVKLKRMLSHSSHYMYESVRTDFIKKSLEFLVKSTLYREENIGIDAIFLEELCQQENVPFVVHKEDANILNAGNDGDEIDIESNCSEVCDDLGDDDVMVNDRYENVNQEVRVIAPGENKRPIPWLNYENIFHICFPSIFGGENDIEIDEKTGKRVVSVAQMAKSYVRNYKKKCCNPIVVFFLCCLKMETFFSRTISVCMRRSKTKNVRAGNVLDRRFVHSLVAHNDAYRFMKTIKFTPAYYERLFKDVMAMIRQIGPPTLFITLSCAERSWPEVLQHAASVNGTVLSDKEALDMEEAEKCKLVRDNPDVFVRYYDKRQSDIVKFMSDNQGPFGKHYVVDYSARHESQKRGAQHTHMLVWLKDAPLLVVGDEESEKQYVEFVDMFLTCENDFSNPYVSMQKHSHTFTCYKYGKKQSKQSLCRFGFPMPVMRKSMVLSPLPKEHPDIGTLKKKFVDIQKCMKDLASNEKSITFEDVLKLLGVDENEYYMAIRSSLKRSKVFLKRDSRSVMINGYNRDILNILEANMDLQPVLGYHGLAKYLCKYLCKVESGLSKFLRKAKEDVENDENSDIYQRFRKFANAFLNGNLMSAQEACSFIMGLRAADSSRTNIFIPTAPPDERVHILKSVKELEKLDADSEDIYAKDLIQKYEHRTSQFDHFCLAEYAAYCIKVTGKCHNENDVDDDDLDKKFSDPIMMEKERKKAKIINFFNYKIHQNPENYYREHLLLYLPFKDEIKEVQSVNFKQEYERNLQLIVANKKKFTILTEEEELSLFEEIDFENNVGTDDEDCNSFDIPNDQLVDIADQGGINQPKRKGGPSFGSTRCSEIVPELELFRDLRLLNEKQREIVQHVYKADVNGNQEMIFLSGSAGVGKSLVIKVISNLITRRHNRMPGQKCDALRVLLTCYTGKGAQVIGGTTLHSAFSIQGRGEKRDISENVRNTISVGLQDVKMFVVDEISFVSSNFLIQVYNRIASIMKVSGPFGGWITLLVGDLHQLPPVRGCEVFQKSDTKDLEVFIANNFVWNLFSMFELTKIERQKDDQRFIEALNHIAMGKEFFTAEDEALFQERVIAEEAIPEDAIVLCCVNRMVSHYNSRKMDQRMRLFEPYECLCESVDKIDKNTTRMVTKQKLDQYYLYIRDELEPRQSQSYCSRLRLQIDFKYMVIANLDIEDGIINGLIGILKDISYSEKTHDPEILWFEFEDKNCGRALRAQYRNRMLRDEIDANLVPIVKNTVHITLREFSFSRRQFPMTPAYAMTIHKSQGSTFEKVCVDMTGCDSFSSATLWRFFYVAFSRIRKLENLYIMGSFTTASMKLPSEGTSTVSAEMKRLRTSCALKLNYNNFQTLAINDVPIVYLNVNSLKKSLPNIVCDRWYLAAKILIFSETKTKKQEDIRIENFNVLCRTDHDTRNSYGVLCYIRDDFGGMVTVEDMLQDENGKVDLVLLLHNNEEYLITGYRSPTYEMPKFKAIVSKFCRKLDTNKRVHIMGDFNIDSYGSKDDIFKVFEVQNLKNKLDPFESTRGSESQIDVVLSNSEYVEAGSYATYFSDHFAVYLIAYHDKSFIRADPGTIDHAHGWADETNFNDQSEYLEEAEIAECDEALTDDEANDQRLGITVDDVTTDHELDDDQFYLNLQIHCENAGEILDCLNYAFVTSNSNDLETRANEVLAAFNFDIDFIVNFVKMKLNIRRYHEHADNLPFFIQKTTGDGNCFYNSISKYCVEDESLADVLRIVCIDCYFKNKAFYERKFSILMDENFEAYNERTMLLKWSTERSYADLSVIYAVILAFEVNLCIRTYPRVDNEWTTIYSMDRNIEFGHGTVCLNHTDAHTDYLGHYELVLCKNDEMYDNFIRDADRVCILEDYDA
jgi:hypothetical protein